MALVVAILHLPLLNSIRETHILGHTAAGPAARLLGTSLPCAGTQGLHNTQPARLILCLLTKMSFLGEGLKVPALAQVLPAPVGSKPVKVEALAYGALEGKIGELAPSFALGIDESKVPYSMQARSLTYCATVQNLSAVASHIDTALVKHADLEGKLIVVVNPSARIGIADETEKTHEMGKL